MKVSADKGVEFVMIVTEENVYFNNTVPEPDPQEI